MRLRGCSSMARFIKTIIRGLKRLRSMPDRPPKAIVHVVGSGLHLERGRQNGRRARSRLRRLIRATSVIVMFLGLDLGSGGGRRQPALAHAHVRGPR